MRAACLCPRFLTLNRRVQRHPHGRSVSAQGRGHLSGHLRPPQRPSAGSLRRRACLALEHQPVGLVGSELRRHLRCVAPACVRVSVESKDAPAARPDVEVQCHAALLPVSLQLSTRAAPIERRRPRLWNHACGHRRRHWRPVFVVGWRHEPKRIGRRQARTAAPHQARTAAARTQARTASSPPGPSAGLASGAVTQGASTTPPRGRTIRVSSRRSPAGSW